MLYSIDARLIYRVADPCEVLVMLEAARTSDQNVIAEQFRANAGDVAHAENPVTGARQTILTAAGDLDIAYTARVEVTPRENGLSHAAADRIRDVPLEVRTFLRPSRYCPSDRFERFVRRRVGHLAGGEKVEAIVEFVREHLVYDAGASDRFTTASETFSDGAGVCRDFAHLAITLCRAADIPARAVSAYAWRLEPPDLHAVVEVFLSGRWWLVDPTGKAPVDGLIRIATGRDAADIAFMSIFGSAELVAQSFLVSALESQPATTGPAPDLALPATS